MADGDASSGRATVVVVTDPPGSGKSTLGVELAGALRVPFLARDDIRGGLFVLEGSWTDRPRRRNLGDRLPNREAVLDELGYASIEQHTSDAVRRMEQVHDEMQTEFARATMRIDTDHGLEPRLEAMIEHIATSAPTDP